MSAPGDVLAVLDGCIAHAEKMIACLRHEGDERAAKWWDVEVIRQRKARAAVAELIEATEELVGITSGAVRCDCESCGVKNRAVRALARVKGGAL